MKRSVLVLFALLGALALLASSGCLSATRHSARHHRAPTVALAVTVQGGLPPTPAQWSIIQARVAQEIAARGWVLVTDPELADQIMRVDFRPNPNDPENSGTVVVLGYRENPFGRLVIVTPATSRATYSYRHVSGTPFSTFSGWRTGYLNGYYAPDYSGIIPRANPGTTQPPPAPPRINPPDTTQPCPPDAIRRPPHFVHHRVPGSPDHPEPDQVRWRSRPDLPSRGHGRAPRISSDPDRSTHARHDSGSSSSRDSFSSSSSSSTSSSSSYSSSSSSAGSSSSGSSGSSYSGPADSSGIANHTSASRDMN